MGETKWCPDCGQETPVEEFNRGKGYCRVHERERARRYREWRRQELAKHPPAFREQTPEQKAKELAREAEYRATHADLMLAASRRNGHVTRARRHGTAFDRYDPHDIYERDGWICQVCYQPVDPHLRCPHPGAATIDHVIPLGQGGPDTRENVRLAHRRCNLKRSRSRAGGSLKGGPRANNERKER